MLIWAQAALQAARLYFNTQSFTAAVNQSFSFWTLEWWKHRKLKSQVHLFTPAGRSPVSTFMSLISDSDVDPPTVTDWWILLEPADIILNTVKFICQAAAGLCDVLDTNRKWMRVCHTVTSEDSQMFQSNTNTNQSDYMFCKNLNNYWSAQFIMFTFTNLIIVSLKSFLWVKGLNFTNISPSFAGRGDVLAKFKLHQHLYFVFFSFHCCCLKTMVPTRKSSVWTDCLLQYHLWRHALAL